MGHFVIEKWKEYPIEVPGKVRYAVSNHGRLKSFTDTIENGKLLKGALTEGFLFLRYNRIVDGKRSYYRVGFTMDKRKKDWAMKMLRDWLLAVKENDPITGLPMIRTIDWIFSKRILNEGIEYEEGGNYDHISSLLGLMILISKLSGGDVPNLDNEEEYESPEEKWARTHLENVQKTRTNQRSAFLQY